MTPSSHPDDLLSALLDDELDPDTAQAVHRHLGDCASCRQELAEVGEARRSLREAPPVPAPASLFSQLIARRRQAHRRGAALGLAAAVVAVVTSMMFADPAAMDGSATSGGPGASEKVDRDARPRRESPRSIRGAGALERPEPSLSDRAQAAARELLDFLG